MTHQVLLMTRPQAVAERFVARLDRAALRNVEILYAPLIEIAPSGKVPAMTQYKGAIFTSGNAVELAPDGAGRPAYCVGARTAALARDRGWNTPVIAQDANDLVQQMSARKPEGPLLHLAGAHRRGEIAERLTAQGLPVEICTLYNQPLRPLSLQAQEAIERATGERPVILPLFSPRAAQQFGTQAPAHAEVRILAMSQAVADALGTGFGDRVEIAAAPTGEEMRRGVEKLLRRNRLS